MNEMNAEAVYEIRRAIVAPELRGDWDGPAWGGVEAASLTHFYATDESHRPITRAKALYDDTGLWLHFQVQDRYVRSVETRHQGRVWEDACAEFFVQPKADRGYFNVEMNCGGTLLLGYHEHPDWQGPATQDDPEEFVAPQWLAQVEIFHSMPATVEPEHEEPVVWRVEYRIPLSILEAYVGSLGALTGQCWRANFYKCAENNSHPHWAAWSPIAGELNFHQPNYFGTVRLI